MSTIKKVTKKKKGSNTKRLGSRHLNLLKHEINPDHLKNKFSHLKDVNFHLSDADNVSILIGADITELHICCDVRQG